MSRSSGLLLFAPGLFLALLGCAPEGSTETPAIVEPAPAAAVAPMAGTCSAAGPQSPRDIGSIAGENPVTFEKAPPFTGMQLCDVHFHRFAEHRAVGVTLPA